ncbi:MAG TPA: hypothetical protein VK615_15775, partial [Candidatus Binatia bacterium]|nr:hypothetical protein [Candidatus Binatia bacterium]
FEGETRHRHPNTHSDTAMRLEMSMAVAPPMVMPSPGMAMTPPPHTPKYPPRRTGYRSANARRGRGCTRREWSFVGQHRQHRGPSEQDHPNVSEQWPRCTETRSN